MKRTIIAAGALAGGLFFMPNALADEPSQRCDNTVIDTPSGGTSGTLNACVPGVGGAEASGSADGPSGYVVADGDSSGQGPLDGYIGVEGDSGGATVVGSCSGDHDGGPGEPITVEGLTGGDTTDCQP